MPKSSLTSLNLDKIAKKRNKLVKTIASLQAEVDAIDSHIDQIAHSLGFGVSNGKVKAVAPFKVDGRKGKRKHKMSAAGRARIAAAQRARWAKVKSAK